MPTPDVIDGTTLLLSVDAVVIAGTTDHSLSSGVNMRDTTTKDSGGKEEVLPGTSTRTIDFSGLASFVPAFGFVELDALIDTKTKVEVVLTNGVVGDTKWTGDAFLESLDVEAPTDDNVTFSGTFHVTGGLTPSVIV